MLKLFLTFSPKVKLGKEDKVKSNLDRLPLPVAETSYSSWDPIRATRQNQDIQREVEDTCMFDIQVRTQSNTEKQNN